MTPCESTVQQTQYCLSKRAKGEDEIESNLNIISPENISFLEQKSSGGFLAFILLLNGSSISSYHRKQETELQVNQLRPEHIRNGPYSAFCADDLGVAQRWIS